MRSGAEKECMVHGLAGYQVAKAGSHLGRHVQTNGRWSPHFPCNRIADTGEGSREPAPGLPTVTWYRSRPG